MEDLGFVVDDAHRFSPAEPDEKYVYGACCPGWHSAGSHNDAVGQWMAFMQDEGIERISCLLTGRQLDEQGANVDQYRDEFGVDNVLHAPIPDLQLVDRSVLTEEILPFLRESVEAEQPVVVHCLAGLGRTGQVLAAWLVSYHEYDPKSAVDTVRETGRDPMETIKHGNATKSELYELLDSFY